jgi:hypothetical protein
VREAQKALRENNFVVAKTLFADLHEKMPSEVSFVQKLTLATYKAEIPSKLEALKEARHGVISTRLSRSNRRRRSG